MSKFDKFDGTTHTHTHTPGDAKDPTAKTGGFLEQYEYTIYICYNICVVRNMRARLDSLLRVCTPVEFVEIAEIQNSATPCNLVHAVTLRLNL